MTSSATSAPLIETFAFSHGTLEWKDPEASIAFYREFLGVRCVRMGPQLGYMWLGGDWLIACLAVGDLKLPQAIENRFVLRVASQGEVDEAYQAALEQRDRWKIKEIRPVVARDGEYSFCLEDLDENWWEIAYRPGRLYDDLFAQHN